MTLDQGILADLQGRATPLTEKEAYMDLVARGKESVRKLAARWNWSKSKAHRFLQKLSLKGAGTPWDTVGQEGQRDKVAKVTHKSDTAILPSKKLSHVHTMNGTVGGTLWDTPIASQALYTGLAVLIKSALEGYLRVFLSSPIESNTAFYIRNNFYFWDTQFIFRLLLYYKYIISIINNIIDTTKDGNTSQAENVKVIHNDKNEMCIPEEPVQGQLSLGVEDNPPAEEPTTEPKEEPTAGDEKTSGYNSRYSPEFLRWYAVSLRKEDKAKAYKFYLKALASPVSHELLYSGWVTYNEERKRLRTQKKYIKKPWTWLKDEMYLNYVDDGESTGGDDAPKVTIADDPMKNLTEGERREFKVYPHWYELDDNGYYYRTHPSYH